MDSASLPADLAPFAAPAPAPTPQAAYLARAAATRARARARAADARHQAPHELPSYNYLLCAANRHHYLPAHPTTDAEFYAQVVQHRDWAALDEQEEVVHDMTRFTGDTSFLADIHVRPRVFCTLHLGSYRQIHHFLLRHGVHYTLVVDSVTLEQQGDKFLALRDDNPLYHGGSLRVLNAEAPSIGLQMIREIKSGRSLLFYIDGNTGVGGMDRQDDKLTLISFLERHIFARKGIAFLAHVTRSPIVPLVAFRHGAADFEMQFFAPIVPDAGQPRETFATETTQHIFRLFEPALRRYPEQWEGWLYLEHFIDLPALRAEYAAPLPLPELPAQPAFNQPRYGLFWQDGHPQLFDRLTYHTFAVSGPLMRLLQQLATLPAEVGQRFAATPLFRDLCHRQVIVAAPVA